jgi:tRNA(His) 5'-end guanylyltransferase
MDSLGDRIKRYEHASNYALTPRSSMVIRVDGKAFHTWTRGMERPFDPGFVAAMQEATRRTAAEMMGFKLAYTQSDEATFLLTDYDTLQSQGWFGYELSKVVSVSASLFTAHFNWVLTNPAGTPAFFDSRAFIVPADDVPNVFVWRQRDWERNSLQMLARAYFSHRQLHGKGSSQVHEMLHDVGVNWADLPPHLKNGTFVLPDGRMVAQRMGYEDIRELITPPIPEP